MQNFFGGTLRDVVKERGPLAPRKSHDSV